MSKQKHSNNSKTIENPASSRENMARWGGHKRGIPNPEPTWTRRHHHPSTTENPKHTQNTPKTYTKHALFARFRAPNAKKHQIAGPLK